MAWPVTTYADTAMIDDVPSKARLSLHALCTAINERQAAIDITKTQFYKADGSLAADVSLADLLDIPAYGANSLAYQNLEKVRAAIVSMVTAGYFVESSGVDDAWTVSSLGAAVGIDLTESPTRMADAAWWQGIQDALDLLIYARREAVVIKEDGVTTRHYRGYLAGFSSAGVGVSSTSPADAWSELVADSDHTTTSGTLFLPRWNSFDDQVGFPSVAHLANEISLTEDLRADNDFAGSLQAVQYKGGLSNTNYNGSTWYVTFGGGSSTDLLAEIDGSSIFEVAGDPGDGTLGGASYFDIQIDESVPSSPPFDDETGVQTRQISFGTLYMVFYFDIAGELTDQA